jgi:hypothetical protein
MKDIGTLVYTAKDTYEAALICSALGDADIPSYTKELGAGQVFKVYTGFSNCGVEIYVPDEIADRAGEIIDTLQTEDAAAQAEAEKEAEMTEPEEGSGEGPEE